MKISPDDYPPCPSWCAICGHPQHFVIHHILNRGERMVSGGIGHVFVAETDSPPSHHPSPPEP